MEELYKKNYDRVEYIFRKCLDNHYDEDTLGDTLNLDEMEIDSGLRHCYCLNRGLASLFDNFMYSTDFSYSKKLYFLKIKIKEQALIHKKQDKNRSLKRLLLFPMCFMHSIPRWLKHMQYERDYERGYERELNKIQRTEVKERKKEQELYKTVKTCLGDILNKDIITIVNSFLFTYSYNQVSTSKPSKKAHDKSQKHLKYMLENKVL